MLVLVLLGTSFFLFHQAGGSDPEFTLDQVHVVEGTVATAETTTGSAGSMRRPTTVVVHSVTLVDRPQNLTFGMVLGRPGPGAQVRLEILDDPQEQFARAAGFPESRFETSVVGVVVDGKVEQSAAETVARAESAARSYRTGALACLVLGLAGGGVLLHRRWPQIRSAIRSTLDRG